MLVVNTASYCGFTPQYEGLEKLYCPIRASAASRSSGFPSGDFGNQEKTNNKEIAEFCFNTYGVKFPMFAKSSVDGLRPTRSSPTGEGRQPAAEVELP